ncbi:MAG TPA: YbhB/YbcL family Raf kinase inhibitor-like protein [Thermoplasmata archaeon]|nr:YbhB/YbcL family Raf kinase inhibitor-like protein [Thermoplasmata archaeon]
MRLWSNDFQHGEMIPSRFTCDGEDISPHLAWEDVPEGTKSFVLIVDDPDAPMGVWKHWLLCDIPPELREIDRNSVPAGAREITNDFGKKEYGGPCPPSGTHRYFFKLYALDVPTIGRVNKRSIYKEVEKHKLDEAVLMGTYRRGF